VNRSVDLDAQPIFKEEEIQYPFVRESPLLEEAPSKHAVVQRVQEKFQVTLCLGWISSQLLCIFPSRVLSKLDLI
jgi:hypothetical protein